MTKANIHPEHLRKSGGKLKDFGGKIEQAGSKLEEAGQNLQAHASGDRSGVGSVVAKFTGKATEITGVVFKEGGRVAGSAGGRLGNTADLYEEADDLGAKGLKKVHKSRDAKPVAGGGARSGSSVGSGGGRTKKAEPVAGGGTRSGSRVGSGGGKKDHEVPSLSGDLNDPPKSTRDYDSRGKTVNTDDLTHPDHSLIDDNLIKKAQENPDRVQDALKPGADQNHPVVKGIVPKDYDPTGGLGQTEWNKRYWPSGKTDAHGNPELMWPDPQKHPQGFESPESRQPTVLQPGHTIDRFGPGFGRFTSPTDTPFPQRGLPPGNLSDGYHQYEVVKPIPVWEGPIAPAMKQDGGGTQYYMPHSVIDLVNAGYLREVKL
ncbi:TNT domain-containing protein [Kutzneria sp. NPDC051319]|uniref:TNT domain-containing protein n=1 Tax=Kutzneria sp. NPDC051319 TaxID=3155047 RepID=UPI003432A4D5